MVSRNKSHLPAQRPLGRNRTSQRPSAIATPFGVPCLWESRRRKAQLNRKRNDRPLARRNRKDGGRT
eukprot:179825-Alexandrium_andersonii.AAC.1